MGKFSLILLGSMLAVLGQDEKSRVRVIAIGKDPMISLANLPPPLTYLPPVMFFQNSDGDVASVPLKIEELSGGVEVPGGEVNFPVRLENRASAEPWFDVTLPKTGDYLVVLSKPKGAINGGWKKVRCHVVDLGDRDFPEGSIRFVNASKSKLIVRAAPENAFVVEAGSVVVRERQPGRKTLLIGFEDGNRTPRMAFKNFLPQAKEGQQLSCFAFDDEDRKVKVKVVKEKTAVPTKVGP